MPTQRAKRAASAASRKSKTKNTAPRRIEDLDPAMKGKPVPASTVAALHWHSYRDPAFTIQGLPWFGASDPTLRRLPARAQALVRPAVWDLAHHPSGARLRFQTDSSSLTLRITHPHVEMLNMAPIGHSGIDLYVGPPEKPVYWNVTRPNLAAQRAQQPYEYALFDHCSRDLRECTLYLPVYNQLNDLEIGLDAGARILPPTPYAHAKPIVFYGTSITHSGCASRPSNGYVPILGRRLNSDVVNLGFSGNGVGEPEVARLVAELDAAVFVLDYEANAGLERMRENLLPFCEILREKHPDTPLILLTKICFPKVHRMPGGPQGHREALELYHQVAENIRTRFRGLTLVVDGWSLIGPDSPLAYVDESHPNDYGFNQMATALAPVLHAVLTKS